MNPPTKKAVPSDYILSLSKEGSETRRRLDAWRKYGTARKAAEALKLNVSDITNAKWGLMKTHKIKSDRQRIRLERPVPEVIIKHWDEQLSKKFLSQKWPGQSDNFTTYRLGGFGI